MRKWASRDAGIQNFRTSGIWALPCLLAGLACLALSSGAGFAQSETLKFIYIHGTNHNTESSHAEFNAEVARLHPHIAQVLENEPLAKKHLLNNGQMTVDPQTLNFFWGDQSALAIEAVRRNIFIPQFNKGVFNLGERARKKLAFTLHDAIWVEQQTNKKEIVNQLFAQVSKTGSQPIMLMGHSAGSLVAFDFLMYRLPYLDIQDFARDLRADPAVLGKIKAAGKQYTCLEALLTSSGVRVDAQGKLVPFFSGIEPQIPPELLELYRNQWLENLSGFTRQYCLPEGKVRGLVTFGSPLALFYSLVANPVKDESYLTASMMSYMLARNIVWLHVNHWNDFIALPMPDKQRILTMVTRRMGASPQLEGGFIYNYIYTGGGATFLHAHSWYWNRPGDFSATLAKAYRLGYQSWYPSSK